MSRSRLASWLLAFGIGDMMVDRWAWRMCFRSRGGTEMKTWTEERQPLVKFLPRNRLKALLFYTMKLVEIHTVSPSSITCAAAGKVALFIPLRYIKLASKEYP
jgi:hypothetical protein